MTNAELQIAIDAIRNATADGSVTNVMEADIMDALKEKQITANSYSTDETLTGGTWIDGKPIYRKVVNITDVNGYATYDISSLNIEQSSLRMEQTIIIGQSTYSSNMSDSNVAIVNGDKIHTRVSYRINYDINGYIEIGLFITKFNYTNDVVTNTNVQGSCVLILEYTKTTD